jgi:glucosyl-dolichyl phosphate glucuronosyltransferase
VPEIRSDIGAGEDPAAPLTVVICAYTNDRWIVLRRALDAVLRQIRRRDEVLLIIDHNDALLGRCRDTLSGVTILANNHKAGLSGARNTALDAARGPIIVFLDDDAVPLDGWLDALREPYADSRVYGVGGVARPRWQQGRPPWFPDEFLWVVGCSHRGLPIDQQPVRNLLGANMSFRRIAFSAAGYFTEHMGRVGQGALGCEETEFSIRLTQVRPDVTVLLEPSSLVEHYVPRQRASMRYFVRRCWGEGLSKAEVTRRVGRASALASERDYVRRVLPRAIWSGICHAAAGDVWGLAQAGAIVTGLAATTLGYCAGAVNRPGQDRTATSQAV